MDIKNVLSDEELQKKLTKLCNENFIARKITETFTDSDSARNIINNWPNASRKDLLNKLNIFENKEYPGIYHEQ